MERLIVDVLRSYGLDAYRIPLSGAQRGFNSDVEVRIGKQKLLIEAKSRKHGFSFIYDALGDNDALCIKTDREDPLIVLNLRRFSRILREITGIEASPAGQSHDQSNLNKPSIPNINPRPIPKELDTPPWE